MLENWTDVDNAIKEIGECELMVGSIQANMNIKINAIKEDAVKLSAPHIKKIAELKDAVQAFAEGQKADLDGKSKVLNFGTVGFRQSSNVTVPAKKIEAVLKNLRKYGMDDCITVKESVNKDVLKRYSDKEIAMVGASRKVQDNFFLETDLEKLRATGGGSHA